MIDGRLRGPALSFVYRSASDCAWPTSRIAAAGRMRRKLLHRGYAQMGVLPEGLVKTRCSQSGLTDTDGEAALLNLQGTCLRPSRAYLRYRPATFMGQPTTRPMH